MLLKIYRYLLGYVVAKGESPACEDFLVSCTKAGIKLWGFKKYGCELSFSIRAKHYKLLRHHCRKTNTRIHIIKKAGIYFLLRKYKKRLGLFTGFIIILIVGIYLSGSVLTIKVQGNFAVESHEVISTAKELGLDVFARKSEVDFAVIEHLLPGDLPMVSWCGITVIGTEVTINISEVEPKSEPEKETHPTDVISTAEGQIIRIIPTNGQAVVNVGDGVIKGQLLISGVLTDTAGNVTLTHASGEVYALTTREEVCEFKAEVTVREYIGEPRTRYFIIYSDYKIPLYLGGETGDLYETTITTHKLNIFGYILPFEVCEEVVSEYTEKTLILDDTSAEKYGLTLLETQELTQLLGVKIHDRQVTTEKTKTGYIITGVYTCEEEISQLKDIVAPENP